MEWHFLVPAVSFLIVTAVVAATGIMSPDVDRKPSRTAALFLVPGFLAAAFAWFGERLVESRIIGSDGFTGPEVFKRN